MPLPSPQHLRRINMNFLNKIRKPFRYSFNNTVFYLIGINILIYLLTSISPIFYNYLSLNVIYVVRDSMYWQFFTYMFVHGSLSHLIFNMLGLLFFGLTLERAIGSKEFLLLYLLSGFVCGVFSFLVYYFTGNYRVFLLGASGAVYAVLLSYAVVFPRSQIFIWGILPIPAPILIGIYAGIEIFNQFLSLSSGVAHMTHLAGFAFAWLYIRIRMGISPWKIWKDAFR